MLLVAWVPSGDQRGSRVTVYETLTWKVKTSFEPEQKAFPAGVTSQPYGFPPEFYTKKLHTADMSGVQGFPTSGVFRCTDGDASDLHVIVSRPELDGSWPDSFPGMSLWKPVRSTIAAEFGFIPSGPPHARVAFDWNQIAFTSYVPRNHTLVTVVDTHAGKALRHPYLPSVRPDDLVRDLCWSRDGKRLFGLFGSGIFAWEVSDGKHVQSFLAGRDLRNGRIGVSPDGGELTFADGVTGEILKWSIQTSGTEQ